MGYAGQTYVIPCSKGGLNHSPNIADMPPEAMVFPSRNINMHRGGREPRGGTAKVNASAGYGSVRIMGGFDYINAAGTQFQVVVTTDGKIWKNTTETIKASGWTAGKHASFVVMNNLLYICNGYDRPQTWNGTDATTTDLANIPTDWTGTNWPKQLLVHGSGNSERMWAIMPAGKKTLYASANNNGVAAADFSTANVLIFYLETGDSTGLTGMVEHGDRLFVFSKRRSFIMQDSDSNTDLWGYLQAQWVGGVANHNLIVKTPNDVICMMDDGEAYSLSAVQSYGDYEAASITKPAYIDAWIRELVNRGLMEENAHAIYNPNLRCIDFFLAYSGDTNADNDLALRYFIDRGPAEGWMPQDNQSSASGYDASCSFLFKVTEGNYEVRTGDYSGFIWKLESGTSDDGVGFYAGFKTAYMNFGDARKMKHFFKGWVVCVPKGAWNLLIKIYIDGTYKATSTVSLAPAGATLGAFILDTSVLAGDEIISASCPEGYIGQRIAIEPYTLNAGETFFISSLPFDFKMLGARA